ncbi:MAG TPA: hypothetical protein VHM00_03720 [Caldimonas sp.]|nr:hypothetical protein [Caldimonas sp.]HEX2540173.1 hypothetical protein [Caldimonas sp.]
MQLFFGTRRASEATVEYWQWRYRDASTGRACRTTFRLSAEEAAKYPDAERIEGTLVLRKVVLPQAGHGLFRRRAGARVSSPV